MVFVVLYYALVQLITVSLLFFHFKFKLQTTEQIVHLYLKKVFLFKREWKYEHIFKIETHLEDETKS